MVFQLLGKLAQFARYEIKGNSFKIYKESLIRQVGTRKIPTRSEADGSPV